MGIAYAMGVGRDPARTIVQGAGPGRAGGTETGAVAGYRRVLNQAYGGYYELGTRTFVKLIGKPTMCASRPSTAWGRPDLMRFDFKRWPT